LSNPGYTPKGFGSRIWAPSKFPITTTTSTELCKQILFELHKVPMSSYSQKSPQQFAIDFAYGYITVVIAQFVIAEI
jgi:hypothetical protein